MTDSRRQQWHCGSVSHSVQFHCKSFQVKSSRWSYYSLCSCLAQAVHSRVAIASQLRLDRSHRALHTKNTHRFGFNSLSSCLSRACLGEYRFHQNAWLANICSVHSIRLSRTKSFFAHRSRTFAPFCQPRLAFTSNTSAAASAAAAATAPFGKIPPLPASVVVELACCLLTSAMHWPVLETIWYDAAASALSSLSSSLLCFLTVHCCCAEPSHAASSAPPAENAYFSYVYPEPVLVKCTFLCVNCIKSLQKAGSAPPLPGRI
jgi:hypothetical protein